MTHIHPDSIRLLLRCGWTAIEQDGHLYWSCDNSGNLYGITEALALCRGDQPTPSVEEEK